ncbi:MAG TPA: hypothetical protein VH000_03550 [Rhizomicrobium sp.]|nr:hypothetical protein [Rhizomicrobium sp.]
MNRTLVLLACLAATPALAYALPQDWRSYSDAAFGFTIDYPREFTVDTDHDYTALGPGMDVRGVAFMVPSTAAAGTNLAPDSYIGVDVFPRALECTPKAFLSDPAGTHPVKDGGRDWIVATGSDRAAGNIYDETVYVLANSTPCIGVRYFIHSADIGNYDPGAVHAFDRAALISTFDKIRQSLVPAPVAQ